MGCSPRGRARPSRAWGGAGANTSPGRYQGLEQQLETELKAAAISKEEALRELKTRALQLEEELVQVRLAGPWVPHATSSCILPTDVQGCVRSHPPPASPHLVLASRLPCAPSWGLLESTPVLGVRLTLPRLQSPRGLVFLIPQTDGTQWLCSEVMAVSLLGLTTS